MMDFKAFFEVARKSVNLTDANVDGLLWKEGNVIRGALVGAAAS